MHPESYSEFLDPYPTVYERTSPEELLTPWTASHPQAVLLPVDLVRTVARDEDIFKIQRMEGEYIASLAAQIVNHGLREPVTIKVDSSLRCALKDGNHRLVCFMLLGYRTIPVVIKRQDAIKGFAVNLAESPDLLFSMIDLGRYGVVGYG